MGISDFYDTFTLLAPTAFTTIEFSKLHGCRAAIDVSIFLFKSVKTGGDALWLNHFVNFIAFLKNNGVIPLFIFDGTPPIEKQEEQAKRREQQRLGIEKFEKIKKLNDDMNTTDVTSELATLLPNDINLSMSKDEIKNVLQNVIAKLEKQTTTVKPEYIATLKELFDASHFPYLTSETEAEKLCAYLASKKIVDVVITEDTDSVVYGAETMVSKINFASQTCVITHLPEILRLLRWTFDQFVDCCILLGCDYNARCVGLPPHTGCTLHEKHIMYKKPMPIGAKSAVCIIDVYKSIDNAITQGVIINPDVLLHKRCKEIFTFDFVTEYVSTFNRRNKIDIVKLMSVTSNPNVISSVIACFRPTELNVLHLGRSCIDDQIVSDQRLDSESE